jgi:hypothetical protein
MKRFAFITRHQPTREQVALAFDQGIKLVPVGDRDAFSVSPHDFAEFDGVVVVHPAAALRLLPMKIGVFENGNRAKEGEKPEFFAKAIHLF